jgi:hypothetical protein
MFDILNISQYLKELLIKIHYITSLKSRDLQMNSPLKTKSINSLVAMFLMFGVGNIQAQEPSKEVNVLNYVRAKTAFHFDRVLMRSGSINSLGHVRQPIPLDQQNSRRMNRDTLYSSAVIDISQGASFSMPDSGGRYMSAAIINQDHYINKIFHGPGEHTLTLDEFDTPFVLLVIRILVNANDPADIKIANNLQDLLTVKSQSAEAFIHDNYDNESLKSTTQTLIKLQAGLPDVINTFGSRGQVNKVRHLIATAYGWGGLPESETFYLNVQPQLPIGAYSLTVRDVPVDGFWSISVYNKEGFFEPNEYNSYSINNLTAKASDDGSFTIHFGGDPDKHNYLHITEGWNYDVRMYRPRTEITLGSWTFPSLSNVSKDKN